MAPHYRIIAKNIVQRNINFILDLNRKLWYLGFSLIKHLNIEEKCQKHRKAPMDSH